MQNLKYSDRRFVAILQAAEAAQAMMPVRRSMPPTRCAVGSRSTKMQARSAVNATREQ
jgi:hypothetical protein